MTVDPPEDASVEKLTLTFSDGREVEIEKDLLEDFLKSVYGERQRKVKEEAVEGAMINGGGIREMTKDLVLKSVKESYEIVYFWFQDKNPYANPRACKGEDGYNRPGLTYDCFDHTLALIGFAILWGVSYFFFHNLLTFPDEWARLIEISHLAVFLAFYIRYFLRMSVETLLEIRERIIREMENE